MGLFRYCREGRECRRPASRGGRILHFGGHALLGVAVIAVVALVFGWVAMTAWNAVIPAVFNLSPISFWQAVALMVLARILVGRFHHGHRRDGKCGFGRHGRRQDIDTPPDGSAFAQWWWEEGETAFRAFQARKASQDKV